MSVTVDIASVELTNNSLEVTVFVTTDTTETIDYELNINDTGTGGTVTRFGTLTGGAGSFPGDTQTERVSFGVNRTTGGTVTAQITSPEEFVGTQDQVKWGEQDAATQFDITQCDNQPTSSGDLEVSYSVSPVGFEGGDATVFVRVDGQQVGQASHFVPGRGGGFSQTIPARQLPLGEEMPVEVGISGNFRDCGTVTVEDDTDEAAGPQPPRDTDPVVEPENTGAFCSVPRSDVTLGEAIEIPVTVYNNNQTGATVEYNVTANGSVIGTGTEPIDSGGASEVAFPWTPTDVGEYNIGIEITDAY